MQESIRGDESIQELMKANSWWIDYLTNEDLRIEYARWILLGPQNEEREVDQDVVDYYDQQYDEYFKGRVFLAFLLLLCLFVCALWVSGESGRSLLELSESI